MRVRLGAWRLGGDTSTSSSSQLPEVQDMEVSRFKVMDLFSPYAMLCNMQ